MHTQNTHKHKTHSLIDIIIKVTVECKKRKSKKEKKKIKKKNYEWQLFVGPETKKTLRELFTQKYTHKGRKNRITRSPPESH